MRIILENWNEFINEANKESEAQRAVNNLKLEPKQAEAALAMLQGEKSQLEEGVMDSINSLVKRYGKRAIMAALAASLSAGAVLPKDAYASGGEYNVDTDADAAAQVMDTGSEQAVDAAAALGFVSTYVDLKIEKGADRVDTNLKFAPIMDALAKAKGGDMSAYKSLSSKNKSMYDFFMGKVKDMKTKDAKAYDGYSALGAGTKVSQKGLQENTAMRLTKKQLKQIIKEELQKAMNEVSEKEVAVDIAKMMAPNAPNTSIKKVGQKVMKQAMKDPKIKDMVKQIVADMAKKGVLQKVMSEDKEGGSGAAALASLALFGPTFLYPAMGMPGYDMLLNYLGNDALAANVAAQFGIPLAALAAALVAGMANAAYQDIMDPNVDTIVGPYDPDSDTKDKKKPASSEPATAPGGYGM
jgi:hypothetical protein